MALHHIQLIKTIFTHLLYTASTILWCSLIWNIYMSWQRHDIKKSNFLLQRDDADDGVLLKSCIIVPSLHIYILLPIRDWNGSSSHNIERKSFWIYNSWLLHVCVYNCCAEPLVVFFSFLPLEMSGAEIRAEKVHTCKFWSCKHKIQCCHINVMRYTLQCVTHSYYYLSYMGMEDLRITI